MNDKHFASELAMDGPVDVGRSLAGRVAIVSGGAMGIGFVVCCALNAASAMAKSRCGSKITISSTADLEGGRGSSKDRKRACVFRERQRFIHDRCRGCCRQWATIGMAHRRLPGTLLRLRDDAM